MTLLGVGMLGLFLCLVGLLFLGGLVGAVVLLLKLGVIGSYWLKGEEPEDQVSHYRLDESHET